MTDIETGIGEVGPVQLGQLLTAVESVRTERTHRAVFSHAKIIHVVEGAVDVETSSSAHRLTPGMSLALGSARWCRLWPRARVRLWTVYVDENFLRTQMAWFLPDPTRVQVGLHPDEWDGRPMVLTPGLSAMRLLEPVWRQMSVLDDGTHTPEAVAIRTVELFARWVSLIVPIFLSPETRGLKLTRLQVPVNGRLTDFGMVGHVGRSTQILRERMNEPWTVGKLASAVALSRTHLTRLFVTYTGVPPMRFLTEIRLTEFTRLIEETELSVAAAARTVGWNDPRVGSAWFYRRFGMTPSLYRRNPHPHCTSDERGFPADPDSWRATCGHDSSCDS